MTSSSGVIGFHLVREVVIPATNFRYFLKDNLGSVQAILNSGGTKTDTLGYETFGERRFPTGAAQNRASPEIVAKTDRGFTGHEHLYESMLIHMNGRIYDPVIGRFMTPDPFIQAPRNLQSYNRYSYMMNRPLGGTDPSGFKSLGDWVDGIVDSVMNDPGKAIVAVVIAYFTGVYASEFLAASGYEWAMSASFTSADWAGSMALSSAGSAAVGASAGFAGSFVASGGDLKTALKGAALGGIAAGAGAALSEGLGDWGSSTGNAVKNIVVRGTTSVIGGGKFANGAFTAAFGYLFEAAANGNIEAAALESLTTNHAGGGGLDYCLDCGANVDPDGLQEARFGGRMSGRSARFGPSTGPRFDGLRDHAQRHSNLSPNEYYAQAARNMEKGQRFSFYHDEQFKHAFIRRTGPDSFMFTSSSTSGHRIFTHIDGVNMQYLRNLGITLPRGF